MRLFGTHSRHWRDNLYVYPVISRRAAGLSVGVNLNPDKACNFDCIYCQVDRSQPSQVRKVDLDVLRSELRHMVGLAASGELWADPYFAHVPQAYRHFRDIAFSGDGEPTASPQFLEAVRIAAETRLLHGLDAVRLVLITDAAWLDRPRVVQALEILDQSNGEVWAKLDAGTEEHFRRVNRPNVPLTRVLDNILQTARRRPIVIQSLWMRIHEAPPPETEVEAFAGRLAELVEAGAQIKLVQVYTIARQTAEAYVAPLDEAALQAVAGRVRARAGVPAEVFG